MSSLLRSFVDAADVLRRARSAGEGLKALVPASMLARKVLNEHDGAAPGADASDVVVALRKLGNALKAEAISEDGRVDYSSLKGSATYAQLQEVSKLLSGVDPSALRGDAERKAFWINLYNVQAIHGVLALDIVASVMEVPSYFKTVAYRIGAHTLTLDEIENGILRRNAPHPATGARLLKAGDPRLAWCPEVVDPRIHAALVCSSKSCPPVAFYTAEQLDAQLDAAAANYVANDVQIDDSTRVIMIPITFRYYRQDFGGTDGIGEFILRHAPDAAQRDALQRALADKYPFDYHRYDWSLNARV